MKFLPQPPELFTWQPGRSCGAGRAIWARITHAQRIHHLRAGSVSVRDGRRATERRIEAASASDSRAIVYEGHVAWPDVEGSRKARVWKVSFGRPHPGRVFPSPMQACTAGVREIRSRGTEITSGSRAAPDSGTADSRSRRRCFRSPRRRLCESWPFVPQVEQIGFQIARRIVSRSSICGSAGQRRAIEPAIDHRLKRCAWRRAAGWWT